MVRSVIRNLRHPPCGRSATRSASKIKELIGATIYLPVDPTPRVALPDAHPVRRFPDPCATPQAICFQKSFAPARPPGCSLLRGRPAQVGPTAVKDLAGCCLSLLATPRISLSLADALEIARFGWTEQDVVHLLSHLPQRKRGKKFFFFFFFFPPKPPPPPLLGGQAFAQQRSIS